MDDYDAHLEAQYEALFDYTMEEPDDFTDPVEAQETVMQEHERYLLSAGADHLFEGRGE